MPITLLPPNRISPRTLDATAPLEETDLDRFLKLIPTEVVTAYTGLLALGAALASRYYEPALAALGVVAVALVLRRDGRRNNLKPSWRQYVLRCAAFAAWTLVIGNPLAVLGVSLERAHVLGAIAVAAFPLLGYLTLPRPSGAPS